MQVEDLSHHPWQQPDDPATLLLIRLHAFGDLTITIPVIRGLRRRLPETRITLVTSREYVDYVKTVAPVDRVIGLETRGSRATRLRATLGAAARIRHRPDLLLDLQNSRPSRLLTRLLRPRTLATFDRFAPRHALDRTLDVVRNGGLGDLDPVLAPMLDDEERRERIGGYGLPSDDRPLICLNPAGNWPTKQWPAERYAALADELSGRIDARFLLLGTENIRQGAALIRRHSSAEIIDLVDRTSQLDALALLSACNLVISDDSGLMHMAWTNGIPTLALFGATRSVWSRPIGQQTATFGSDDLDCGGCLRAICRRGDRHCLDRLDVATVADRAIALIGTR